MSTVDPNPPPSMICPSDADLYMDPLDSDEVLPHDDREDMDDDHG